MQEKMISAKNLVKSFTNGITKQIIINNLDFIRMILPL